MYLNAYIPMEDYYRAPFLHSQHAASLPLGIRRTPLFSALSGLCRHKWGKALGVSVRVDELLCVCELLIPALVFTDVVIGECFVGNDGPGFQCHIAGDLRGISVNGRTRCRFERLRYEREQRFSPGNLRQL